MKLTKEEKFIIDQMSKSNFCLNHTDCVMVPSTCPFGCCQYVNKYKSSKINKLLSRYRQRCYYDCLECTQPICVKNKCVSRK